MAYYVKEQLDELSNSLNDALLEAISTLATKAQTNNNTKILYFNKTNYTSKHEHMNTLHENMNPPSDDPEVLNQPSGRKILEQTIENLEMFSMQKNNILNTV